MAPLLTQVADIQLQLGDAKRVLELRTVGGTLGQSVNSFSLLLFASTVFCRCTGSLTQDDELFSQWSTRQTAQVKGRVIRALHGFPHPLGENRAVSCKGFPYSLPSVGSRADPGVQAVGPQATISHPPGGRMPLLSTKPAVTFPAAEHHRPLVGTKLYCLVTEAHRCEQLAQGCYSPSRIWTHDLLIASPTPLYWRPYCVCYAVFFWFNRPSFLGYTPNWAGAPKDLWK